MNNDEISERVAAIREAFRVGSMTQGKCDHCKVAFRWKGKPLLREALCPRCKEPLSKTTRHLKSMPWVESHPIWHTITQKRRGREGKPYRGEG